MYVLQLICQYIQILLYYLFLICGSRCQTHLVFSHQGRIHANTLWNAVYYVAVFVSVRYEA